MYTLLFILFKCSRSHSEISQSLSSRFHAIRLQAKDTANKYIDKEELTWAQI